MDILMFVCCVIYGIVLISGNVTLIILSTFLIPIVYALTINPQTETSCRTRKKSDYYKSEFEEHQHFKIVNKGIFTSQVRGKLEGDVPLDEPAKDWGLLNNEKKRIAKREVFNFIDRER